MLRKNPRLRDLVLVVVSGQAQEELERVAGQVQVDGVLTKEEMSRELPALLKRQLAGRAER